MNMGNIYVNSVDSQPLSRPVPMGIANVLMLGFDDANDAIFDSASNPVSAASLGSKVAVITSYAEFLSIYNGEPEDTPLKRSVEDYFNEEAGYGVDAAKIYLYRFSEEDTGDTITDETALPGVDVTEWRTVISPVTAVSMVKVSYNGAIPESQAGGYAAEQDADTGLYTGKVTFDSGFPKHDGEYQAINPALDEVLISYTTGGLETALKVVANIDVQYVMACYDNGKMTGTTPAEGIYGGTSLVNDYKKLAGFVNQSATRGYYRSAICALPANAKPGDTATAYGAVAKWKDLRNNDLGNNKRVIVAAFKQAVGTTGYYGQFDTAAYMAALIRKCRVREDVGGTKNNMAVDPYDDDAMQYAFKNARICTIVAAPSLIEGTFLNFGYTLGSRNDRSINHVRCFDQIRHLAEARLLAAIVDKRIPYNVEGAYVIMSIIGGAIQTAQMCGWCEGLAEKSSQVPNPINIPIMAYMTKANKTPADWETITNAANSGTWTGIQFTVKWGPNTERIELAPISEVAF